MKKAVLFQFIVLVVLAMAAGAQAEKANDPEIMIEKFLKVIQQEKINKAYDMFLAESDILEYSPSSVEVLKTQTKQIFEFYGEAIGHEQIYEERFGQSLRRYVYILKTRRLPITWEFYFYKSEDVWKPINIKFNDEYDLLDRKSN